MVFIYYLLRITGFYNRGLRNVLDIQVTENEVLLPGLPQAFEAYTILQLSDLHLDITEGLTEAVIELVKDLTYDLCVITGDYRASTSGSYNEAIEETIKLIPHLREPVYAVLGNHADIPSAAVQFFYEVTSDKAGSSGNERFHDRPPVERAS